MSTNSSNDLDDQYTNRYAGRIEDPEEVLMRADFDRMLDLHNQAWNADANGEQWRRLSDESHHIHERWAARDDELGAEWQYLNDAHEDWTRSPETMTRFHDRIAADEAEDVYVLTDMQRRSQQQARQITGHGEWPQETEQAPADRAPIPGHAFAGLVNDHDREGTER